MPFILVLVQKVFRQFFYNKYNVVPSGTFASQKINAFQFVGNYFMWNGSKNEPTSDTVTATKTRHAIDDARNEDVISKEKRFSKSQLIGTRYLIPNMVTVGSMFCGFLAVVYATSNRFEKASLAIWFAILLDGLDGKIARRLNATSKFGVEFDSLSDLISFGLAPAILMYNWCFKVVADEFGVAICFFYVACAATRLARFNLSDPSMKGFEGLPSPASAATVASLTYFAPFAFTNPGIIALSTIFMISLGLLMVSTFHFFSLKKVKLTSTHRSVPFIVAPLIALLWWKAKAGLLVGAIIYCLSGPIGYIYARIKQTNEDA